mgnify:CR=1 FL=1
MKDFKVSVGGTKNNQYVIIYYNKNRHRYWSGKAINVDISSKENSELLKSAFELKLRDGWRPKPKVKKESFKIPKKVNEALECSLKEKESKGCSSRYIKDLRYLIKDWNKFESLNNIKDINLDNLSQTHINRFIIRDKWSPKTQLNMKTNLSSLLSTYNPTLFKNVKLKKPNSTLHKPIQEINLLLDEIYKFNKKLHLCCLITYGCLLRPHREIRSLKWSNFSSDLSYIKLSGSNNKSGRNRIVPVPKYVRDVLVKGDSELNIFSGKVTPLNNDYFKTLWSRFKRTSTLLEDGQTLYSFRHTGAIDIFKRTGSITKLQKAMGHSSINVSLTYLRGLEVGELTEEDMPVL